MYNTIVTIDIKKSFVHCTFLYNNIDTIIYFLKQFCTWIMRLRSGRVIDSFTEPRSIHEENILIKPERNQRAKSIVQDVCAICRDNIKRPYKLRCGHIYCSDCIFGLIRHEGSAAKCPLCRRSISTTQPFYSNSITCGVIFIAAAAILSLMLWY